MLFNSLQFLIFFPVVTVLYFVIPGKLKSLWLLLSSYFFYMCWNPKYILLILASTLITFLSGLLMERAELVNGSEEKILRLKKLVVLGSLLSNMGILFYFKYSNFLLEMLGNLLAAVHISVNVPRFDILLPVGISFYTFQALGYTLDVYRKEIPAEKNIVRYALFVSFFPQLVAGPIERSRNLIKQLEKPKKFEFERAREGFLLMLWGFFLKLVLADRVALFVNRVYENSGAYPGAYLVVATLLFAVQIYCDFAGYSTIAMGSAKILGIELMDNFKAPYLSTSVAEFWRNWHISLTAWFRDYLYFPLGGNRKGKLRKFLNKLIVFLVSGLWHGASFTYVIWGGLNGLYQILGECLMPLRNRLVKLLGLHRESLGHRLAGGLVTFLLVDFSWIFFRASDVGNALEIIRSIFTVYNPWVLFDGSLYTCGLDEKNFRLMLLGIGILLLSDICKKHGIRIRDTIIAQDYWVRWLVISVSVAAILTFGIWGPGYEAANFIYFQF